MLSNLLHSTFNWYWNTSLQKAKDEKQLWEASNDPTSYVVSEAINATSYVVGEAINKTQALNLPQKLGQFNALTQYYAQHYARSPYAAGIVLTTAGAVIGSPELSALGLVGGCSQAITGSINDLGIKQQREFVKTITNFDDRLTNQQNQLRGTIHALEDTIASLDGRVITISKTLTHQQQELSQTFNRGAETLVSAGKNVGNLLDERLTHQQQELRKTIDSGTEAIKNVTREALQETVSHAGRTASCSIIRVYVINCSWNQPCLSKPFQRDNH